VGLHAQPLGGWYVCGASVTSLAWISNISGGGNGPRMAASPHLAARLWLRQGLRIELEGNGRFQTAGAGRAVPAVTRRLGGRFNAHVYFDHRGPVCSPYVGAVSATNGFT